MAQNEPLNLPLQPLGERRGKPLTHEFTVLGTFYLGKKSSAAEFEILDKAGDCADLALADEQTTVSVCQSFMDSGNNAMSLLHKMPDGHCILFHARWTNSSDNSGRPIPEVYGIRATGDINPMEQLLILHNLKLVNRNNRLALNSVQNDNMRAVQVGQLAEKIAQKKNETINRIVAILIFGENAFVTPQELATIASAQKITPFIPWMGMTGKEIDSLSFTKITKDRSEPGIVGVAPQEIHPLLPECEEFVKRVAEKFGNRDAHFEILLQNISDPSQRRTIVDLFCSDELDKLTTEHKDALPWIQAVRS